MRELKRRYADAPQVVIVLSDGLSTDALLANYEEILPPLLNGLKQAGIRAGAPLFLRHGRVKAEDRIGEPWAATWWSCSWARGRGSGSRKA